MFEWLTQRKTPLSRMNRSQLRRQEILLDKERSRMLKRITKLADEKQLLFEKGTKERSPELRRMLAQEFELKTSEQLMISRQLNIRSKELMTVSRLRMLRENHDRSREAGKIGLVSETDIMRLTRLIEDDSIRMDMYQERLDEVLSIGASADADSDNRLGETGQGVLDVWEQMDKGLLEDHQSAFEEADRRVRERQSAPE